MPAIPALSGWEFLAAWGIQLMDGQRVLSAAFPAELCPASKKGISKVPGITGRTMKKDDQSPCLLIYRDSTDSGQPLPAALSSDGR